MLFEDEKNDHKEVSDSESIEDLKARDCKRLTPSCDAQSNIDNPPLNFFRGSVTSDRLRHESEAQHGGLAHWRHNTSKQRDYSDQVMHGGMGQSARANTHLQTAAIAYGASTGSPGMGLEAENFHAFITGTHQIIRPTGTTMPVQNTPAPQQNADVAETKRLSVLSKTQSDLPLQAVATGEIYNYRRKKSLTFTNLLARARSIIKA